MIGDLRWVLRKAKSWDCVVDEVRESVGNGVGKLVPSTGTCSRLAAGVVFCRRCFD